MSDSKNGLGIWLIALIIVACVSYLNYGTGMAVAAYVLFFVVGNLIALFGLIPIVGIFIYYYIAKFAGLAIMTYAGLAVGTTLFWAIIIYNGIIAFLLCAIVTIYIIVKVIDSI